MATKQTKERRAKLILAKRRRMEAYQGDPMLWSEERLGEPSTYFKWSDLEGYEGHEWDGHQDPLFNAWQTLADSLVAIRENRLDDVIKNIAIESATGTSKTFWLARLVYWFLDTCPDSLVVTSAPSEAQLKLGLWSEISRMFPLIKKKNPTAMKWRQRLILNSRTLSGDVEDSHHAVGFITGAKADDESTDKARGFHRKYMLIILEECTGIPLPILTAFQNTSTGSSNFIVAVGNPNNEHDALHQFSLQPNVQDYRVSAFDYPNIVLGKEIFEGAVSQTSINDRTKVYGEGSPLWNAMVRGISPDQPTDALIKSSWIAQCYKCLVDEKDESYNAVGVDVANSVAGDKAALVWGEANIMRHIEEFQCPNATHLGYNIIMTDDRLRQEGYDDYQTKKIFDFDTDSDCIGVDAVGVGVATVNALLDEGFKPVSLQGGCWKEVIPEREVVIHNERKSVPMYRFLTLRSQMFWELREDFRLGNIMLDLPKHLYKQILKELTIIKFTADGNAIKVESKALIKKRLGGKSPNVADAAAYWNWVRKGYRVDNFGFAAIFAG